ncbi:MAG: hypothetical protein CML96_00195 [Rhodobiaceae bacterium]|nr:hypothetical protein [Rhodobiaceae bacterium]
MGLGQELETLRNLKDQGILDEDAYNAAIAKINEKFGINVGEDISNDISADDVQDAEIVEDGPESSSMDNPGQMGYMYSSPNWSMGVLDFERGQAAYNRIYNNNEFAADANPGMEYLCLYVKVERVGLGDGDMSVGVYDWWWKIVGDRRNIHGGGTINPEPELHAELMVGGSAEGWITRECFAGETGLMTLVESPDYTPTTIWIKLED